VKKEELDYAIQQLEAVLRVIVDYGLRDYIEEFGEVVIYGMIMDALQALRKIKEEGEVKE